MRDAEREMRDAEREMRDAERGMRDTVPERRNRVGGTAEFRTLHVAGERPARHGLAVDSAFLTTSRSIRS